MVNKDKRGEKVKAVAEAVFFGAKPLVRLGEQTIRMVQARKD